MTSEQLQPQSSGRQRQRRSRKKQSTNPLRTPMFSRAVFVAMVVVAAAFLLFSLRELDIAGRSYGVVGVDVPPSDVRYMLGAPTKEGPDGWRYRLTEGGSMAMKFDAEDGRVSVLTCEDEAMVPSSCPGVLGVHVGDAETSVWYRLGTPTRQSFAGDIKSIIYDDLGITLQLRRFTVFRILLTRRPSRFSYLPRALRYILP